METNWFKIWPSRFIGVINRIPDQSLRGDILLIAFHMLNEMWLKDDDDVIAWVTGLSLERVRTLRPYLDRLKEQNRDDGRLMFDFVLDTIVERQEFADKKAKAGQSGGRPPKAVKSTAKHSDAQQDSAEQCDAEPSKRKQTKAIHTDMHLELDKSSSIAHGDSPPVSSRKKPPDPRKDHIAITTCRSVANAFPPKELWDDLILLVGDKPDRAKLESCRKEWLSRGYNRMSWKWATEWYPNGLHTNGNGRASPEGRETSTHYADGREKPEGMKGFVC